MFTIGWALFSIDSGAPAAKQSSILISERKGKPWVDFLMVIMASGIARGHVRTMTTTMTTATELHNMAAIPQILGWRRHCSLGLPCTSLILDMIHVMINWHLSKQASADQYHMTISWAQVYSSSRSRVFLKLTADQVLVFYWIAGSCQVN